ncbi:MAG: hypothetical protein QOD33_1041 [Pyrinomonadaceae bacterium]|nr:hypothetical protein [Pyrinomonadaceae bacterium]
MESDRRLEDCHFHAEKLALSLCFKGPTLPLNISNLLDQLDELKTRFGARAQQRIPHILARISRLAITDADTLVRLHEILLFLCAYPRDAAVRKLAEAALKGFAERVNALREAGADLSSLEHPELSGIDGSPVTDTFSYYVVRWLVNARRQRDRVALAWDWFEDENRLAESWPRFMPLLEEDAAVEANVPYRQWLRAASGGAERDLTWLINQFELLPGPEKKKAELYNAQKLYVRWNPDYRSTRTGMRLRVGQHFYHREPLIRRRDVSLTRELETPPPGLKQLSARDGAAILDLTRAASTVRYRELYGFTHGDAERVLQAQLGRGVDVFIMGVPPERRLPLRAYHAAMIFKNGVPVGYFEGISLFERMESGFNLYYTFRDGETAWLYARILSIFHHLLGVTAFSIDPYQIGFENEEGIESGAFWFYRKLGFRPTNPEVLKLVLNEEKKLATRSGYRTSLATLRKLSRGPMIFEHEITSADSRPGDWDRFQLRNLGLAVQRRMAGSNKGDARSFRTKAVTRLTQLLKAEWRKTELPVVNDFAVALSLVADLSEWSEVEKRALLRVMRAKATQEESSYLQLMQKHSRLRSTIIKLGSQ